MTTDPNPEIPSQLNILFRLCVAGFIFLIILFIVHYIHFRHLRVNVVFFSAVMDGFIAAAITCLIVFLHRFFEVFRSSEKILLSVIFMITGYTLALSIPAVIDRSLSFYFLEKLQQRGGGILHDRMADVFIQEYMKEHHLVDIRMTEQMEAGTISIRDGCVRLTDWGDTLASASRYYRLHFLPTRRLLMGNYSDVLVDPFVTDVGTKDYTCR
jgi:hypothetical protein